MLSSVVKGDNSFLPLLLLRSFPSKSTGETLQHALNSKITCLSRILGSFKTILIKFNENHTFVNTPKIRAFRVCVLSLPKFLVVSGVCTRIRNATFCDCEFLCPDEHCLASPSKMSCVLSKLASMLRLRA